MPISHKRLREGHIVGDRYEIEGFLGSGDTGSVYRGRDLSKGKARIALKLLNGFDPIPSIKESLSRELSFLRRMIHANLARLFDFGILEETGELFLIEEFVDGKDIYAASEQMSLEGMLDLLLELCKALYHIHLQGMVHGSLKPSNAYVIESGDGRKRVKLLDYGLGRWIRAVRRWTGSPMPTYTAPEVLLGGRADASSDIYSLGILAYQLLTRRLPFGDEDPGFLIQKHLQGSVDLRPIERMSGGPVLARLLRVLLDKDPLKRPDSGEIISKLLMGVLGDSHSGKETGELETLFPVTRLVGRERELSCLRESANRVRCNGRGWTVFITGEAGVGKTRCMDELRSWALMEEWRIIEGTCGTQEEESYAPFRQILSRTRPVDGEVLFDFSEAPRRPDSGSFEPASEFAAGQFRDLLTRELVRRLAERPTLLLLHDFHRADEATGTVLDYLSSDIRAYPVLVCVGLRSGEDAKGVLARLMDLAVRQQRGEVVELEPLSRANVGELVAGMTGDVELAKTLGDWTYKNIGGNPFFLEEMLKHLVEQGLLRRESGRWVFTEEDSRKHEIPASLGVVLQRRLAQLSPSARDLSQWLALINRAVHKSFLGSIAARGVSEFNAALHELDYRQMIRVEAKDVGDTVEFRHALIAEVIRCELPKRLSRKMHRRIAEALERDQGAESHLQELAMHYMEGKAGEVAVQYALALAKQSTVEFAHENACRCFEFVLRERVGLNKERLCTTAIDAGDALFALGLSNRAVSLLKKELKNNRNIALDLRAHLFMQIACAYQHLGNSHMQEIYCRKGLRLFRKQPLSNPNLKKAMLWAELAFGSVIQSQPRRGLLFLEKALKCCPNSNSDALVGRIHSLAASLHRVACNFRQALIASEKATQILSHSDDSYLICSAYSTLGIILMGLGRFSRALAIHEKAVSLSHKSRSVILRAQSLGNLAECLCRMGRIQDATSVAMQASKSVGDSNNPSIIHAFNTILAEIELSADNYKACYRIINAMGLEKGQKLALYSLGHANYVSANMHFTLGNYDEALKHIDDLERIEMPDAPFYEHELSEALRARIYFERGLADKALGILNSLDKKLCKKRWPYQICIIKLHIGEVLIRQQKPMEAEGYVKMALRLAKAMHSDILASKGHLLLGMIYSLMGRSKAQVSIRDIQNHPIVKKSYFDKALLELNISLETCEIAGYSDTSSRAHTELSQIYRLLDNRRYWFEHARKAYEHLCRLESQVPSEFLPDYYKAFGRNQIKSELMGVIATNRQQGPASELAMAEPDDDDKTRILLSASATVNSIRELNSLLEAILDQLIHAISVEQASVFLRDEATEKLQFIKGRDINRQSQTGDDLVPRAILEEVYGESRPFVSADAKRDTRVVAKKWGLSAMPGKLFCAPLKVSERVLGVLYADHSSPVEYLSESTISLFAAFCNLAAIAIDNALAHQQLLKEKTELEQYLHQARDEYSEIIGKSPLIEALRDRIGLAAASPLDVLITGESGTGKELVARAIARTGRRKSGRLVPVDCGSLSDSLAEAELFGYRKGAFTGAFENRQGLLEAATGGIIFLDEIANLPFRLQAKLLRVLQEREIRRLGETSPRKIDIQIIAATNKDLLGEIKTGRFRKDLYYRLKAMEIRVPPLRERPEDIPLLIEWFLRKTAEQDEGRPKKFSPEALDVLRNYSYPGNMRELINIVSASYYSTSSSIIGLDELPPEVRKEEVVDGGGESRISERIYRDILEGNGTFDDRVKQPFLKHQFGTAVVRGVIHRALKDTNGRYRNALRNLRVPDPRYSVAMQFLKRNKCYLDYRPFRRNSPV